MAMCVISASILQVVQHSAEEKAIAEKSEVQIFSHAAQPPPETCRRSVG
jgi:hypothetical protein